MLLIVLLPYYYHLSLPTFMNKLVNRLSMLMEYDTI